MAVAINEKGNNTIDECSCTCTNGKVLLAALGTWVECPKCHGTHKIKTHGVVEALNLAGDLGEDNDGEKPKDFYEKYHVPVEYKDNLVTDCDVEFLKASNFCTPDSIGALCVKWINLLLSMQDKKPMHESLIFCVHDFLDSKKYVYTCMKKAEENGLSVVPYITVNGLYRLVHRGLDAQYYSRGDFNYDNYISADVVFLEASAATQSQGWTALADLLSERSRLGKPTYVMSYWNPVKNQMETNGVIYLLANATDKYRLDKLKPYSLIVTVRGGKAKFALKGANEILNKEYEVNDEESEGGNSLQIDKVTKEAMLGCLLEE